LNRPWKFIDLEPDDKKDLNITIASYEDPSFETKFIEIDTGVQVNKLKIVKIKFKSSQQKKEKRFISYQNKKVAPMHSDASAQTVWKYPKNAATQYEPRFLEENEKEKIMDSPTLASFLKESLPQLIKRTTTFSKLKKKIYLNIFFKYDPFKDSK
jgi:hypothetical protein